MCADIGIIGGTGIASRLDSLAGTAIEVPTREGPLLGTLVERDGRSLVLIRRHSAGHKVPPHLVNYKAMALGLQNLGAKACFSTAAVGSLHEDWMPGTMVVCSDFLDFSARNQTLFDADVVHTDFSKPFGDKARAALMAAVGEVNEGVYVCANGPRYETPHEIKMYRQLGGDIVGMTAATEAILMHEADIDYSCLAIVTNLACGLSPTPLGHGEVVAAMEEAGERAVQIILRAAATVELTP
jgi:5'-methylthioadenosine phosphorylase